MEISSMYKKVVYYAPKDLRLEGYGDKPEIEDGEVLVEVEACAICGSDIKMYLHGNPRMRPPITIGHEFCGKIIAVGEGVTSYQLGQRVTMATSIGCGDCSYCRQGKTNLCKNIKAMGFHCDGAMSSYVVIPKEAVDRGNLIFVGDMEAPIACLSEPMSCVMNGLSRVPIPKIKNAAVIGLGALGMFHAIALRSFGVDNIVCVDFPGRKKDIIQNLEFTNRTPDEFEQEYIPLSGGEGFDLVVITAPSNKVQSQAPRYAKKGGYVSYFASLPVGDNIIQVDARLIHYNELVMFGTSDSTAKHVQKAVEILKEHKESIKKIITILPMAQYRDGIEGVLGMQFAKVVLIP